MSLFPTLNLTKVASALLGNIQTQPKPVATISPPRSAGTLNAGVLTPAAAPLASVTGLRTAGGQVSAIAYPSTTSLTTLITESGFVLPTIINTLNKIYPSYQGNVATHAQASNTLSLSTKKFQPYEQLTGISQERPEIIVMLPFRPLYTQDVQAGSIASDVYAQASGIDPYMTDAGLYADVHMQAQNLQAVNALAVVNLNLLTNPFIKSAYNDRLNQFKQSLGTLTNTTNFLLDLVQKTDVFKNKLDLRDDIFKTDPQASAQAYTLNVTNSTYFYSDSLKTYAKTYLPPSYDFVDVMERFGYPTDNSSNLYASSKLWTQLLIELKQVLRFHSLEFLDIEPTGQRNDTNASTFVTVTDDKLFGFSTIDESIPTVSELINVTSIGLFTVIPVLQRAFDSIYSTGAHFSSTQTKIAALANLISKEQKYSLGLSQTTLRQSLTKNYGYAVNDTSTGNLPVFDSVIGQFGTSINDIASTEKSSLASLAQQQIAIQPTPGQTQQSIAVLTFESKYLEGSNGDLTPGSTYYVDSIFQTTGQNFNTSNLNDLVTTFGQADTSFATFINGMNLLSSVNTDLLNQNKGNILSFIANPSTMMTFIMKSMFDKNGNTLPIIQNDRLTSVYVFAAGNPRVKASLFHYTMNKIFRANFMQSVGPILGLSPATSADNTATNNGLITYIMDELLTATIETRSVLTAPGANTHANDLDADTITASLRAGTKMTAMFEELMSQIYTAIQAAAVNSRMRYSGQLNTVVMMAAFDMLISILSLIGDQRINSRKVGGSTNSGKTTFGITKIPYNHASVSDEIKSRLDRELTLTQQVIYCFLNAIQQLGTEAVGLQNYLSSDQSLAYLRSLATTIGDPNLIQMLLSEQQIMLLASTVSDLSTKFNSNVAQVTSTASTSDFGSDEIKILDNSIISPKLRNAVFGTFKSNEFSGTSAFNKRILSVGIPLGFSTRLKQRVRQAELNKTSFVSKQHDIVQVVVYKVDLVNQDVIYKPIRFLFELSRFPVYNDTLYKALQEDPTFEQVANAIPTRDFQESFENNKATSTVSGVAYWNSSKSASTSVKNAMDSSDYSFLLPNEKATIIRNHLMSHMLEVYTKLMTGISLGDYMFDIVIPPQPVEANFVATLVDHTVQTVINFAQFNVVSSPLSNSAPLSATTHATPSQTAPPVGGVLFSTTTRQPLATTLHAVTATATRTTSATGLAGWITAASSVLKIVNPPTQPVSLSSPKAAANLRASLTNTKVPAMVQSLKSVSSLANMQTSLASGEAVSKKILSPKQFDRVFNIIVDPDDFEFDFVKTTATENGTLALQQLMLKGEMVPADVNWVPGNRMTTAQEYAQILTRPTFGGSPDPNLNNFRFRDRDRSEGDLMFEKYFVTIETYGEESV